jgi:hypothetical protein
MKRKVTEFVIGDRVAYSAGWLRSTGCRVGLYPRLRGSVVEVRPFGENQLVTIAWDDYRAPSEYHDDGYGRVIAPNLTLVSRIGIDSALST